MNDADFKYTRASEQVFHSYYRYYNDGDLPGWARQRVGYTTRDPFNGSHSRKLSELGEAALERRVTERIEFEYRRFQKAHKPA